MANNLNISAGVNGNINGMTINSSGNIALVPTGSLVIQESTLVTTASAYQLIFTGSTSPFSTIYIANSSPTGSINVALSASGVVNNLGTVGPATGTSNNSEVIQWNQPFTSLWAQATVTNSFAIFIAAAQ